MEFSYFSLENDPEVRRSEVRRSEELVPIAALLGAAAAELEPLCVAMEAVLWFGQLHFLRRRMWGHLPMV